MIDIENFQSEYDEARTRSAADRRAVRPEKGRSSGLGMRLATLPMRVFLMQARTPREGARDGAVNG